MGFQLARFDLNQHLILLHKSCLLFIDRNSYLSRSMHKGCILSMETAETETSLHICNVYGQSLFLFSPTIMDPVESRHKAKAVPKLHEVTDWFES